MRLNTMYGKPHLATCTLDSNIHDIRLRYKKIRSAVLIF